MNGCSPNPAIPARTAAAADGAVNPTAVTAPTPTMQINDLSSDGLMSRKDIFALRREFLCFTIGSVEKSFLNDSGPSQFGHLGMTLERRVPDQHDTRYVGLQIGRAHV